MRPHFNRSSLAAMEILWAIAGAGDKTIALHEVRKFVNAASISDRSRTNSIWNCRDHSGQLAA